MYWFDFVENKVTMHHVFLGFPVSSSDLEGRTWPIFWYFPRNWNEVTECSIKNEHWGQIRDSIQWPPEYGPGPDACVLSENLEVIKRLKFSVSRITFEVSSCLQSPSLLALELFMNTVDKGIWRQRRLHLSGETMQLQQRRIFSTWGGHNLYLIDWWPYGPSILLLCL
jgi:hypothetical protein